MTCRSRRCHRVVYEQLGRGGTLLAFLDRPTLRRVPLEYNVNRPPTPLGCR